MNIKFKRFLRMALCLLLCAVFLPAAYSRQENCKNGRSQSIPVWTFTLMTQGLTPETPTEIRSKYLFTTERPIFPCALLARLVGKAVQWEAKTSSVYIGQHKSDKPAVWLDEFDYFSSTNHALEKYSRDISDNLGTAYEHVLYQRSQDTAMPAPETRCISLTDSTAH